MWRPGTVALLATVTIVPSADDITRHEDADPDADVWVGEAPGPEIIVVVDADPAWPAEYARLADRIDAALGDRVLALEHVGSTSVPGLAAKPIIDIDLTVADSAHESAYVPALEAVGFRLRIREPDWHEHRCMKSEHPCCNLHVWSPGSPEAIRHVIFRDWLRAHPADRDRYAAAKRSSAEATNDADATMMSYNLRKQPVIREILDRAFRDAGLL